MKKLSLFLVFIFIWNNIFGNLLPIKSPQSLYFLAPDSLFSKTPLRFGAKKAAGTEAPEMVEAQKEPFVAAADRESNKDENAIFLLLKRKIEEAALFEKKIKALVEHRLRGIFFEDKDDSDKEVNRWTNEIKAAIERGRNKFLCDQVRIRIHDCGKDIGFYAFKKLRGKQPPTFAIYLTKDGVKTIHITQAFWKEYGMSLHPDKRMFFSQVLFHELIEDELGELVRPKQKHRFTKHQLMVVLEVLLQNGDDFPPKISKAQWMTLQWAAENNLVDYLESFPPQHPLDFDQTFHKLRNTYLNVLKKIQPLDEQTLWDRFQQVLKTLSDEEKYLLQLELLRGEPLSQTKYLASIMEAYGFQKKDFEDLVAEDALAPLFARLKKLIEEKSEIVNLDQDAPDKISSLPIYESEINRCLKLTRTEGAKKRDTFLKVAKEKKWTRYLILERDAIRILQRKKTLYFVSFAKGPIFVKRDGNYYLGLEMEWAEGSIDLEKFIRTPKRAKSVLPLIRREIIRQLLEAFAQLEEAHLVLHDVKPSNILLCGDPESGKFQLKIIDLGLAHPTGKFLFDDPKLRYGTPHYFTPEEILNGSGDYSMRQDLWKLGTIFYRLLSNGKYPYGQEVIERAEVNEMLIFLRNAFSQPPRPLDLNQIPDPVLKLFVPYIYRMLERNPKRRSPSAKELLRQWKTLDVQDKHTNLEDRVVPAPLVEQAA